jgi:4-carboxymuconolactone decarboxylase
MSDIDYCNTPEYQKGLAIFKAKHPPENLKMIEEMYQLSPELADEIMSHGIYEIWEKKTPNLTMQQKEIASLAVLIDQQNTAQIKAHIITSLRLGITRQQILELLVFLTLYTGVPKITIAYKCVKEAFEEFKS